MSYKNENMKMIELHENGLDIQFRIREKRRGRAGRFFFTGSKKSSYGAEGGYLLSGC